MGTSRNIDVAVIGAGPTGLMLACELAMRGVSVEVLERRSEEPNITRAFAVHARTLELLDARGLADEVLARGVRVPEVAPAPGATLNLPKELRTRYPMIAMVPQSGTEHVLAARAERLGVKVVRGAEVVRLVQDDDGATVELANNDSMRARYVVGCDGAHSTVRRLLGVDFVGKQYETHIMLADVQLTRPPDEVPFNRNNDHGVVIVLPFGDGWFRAIAWDRLREQTPLTEPVSMAEMRDAFGRIAGEDFGMDEMRWSSRFLSERRQASALPGRPGVPRRRRGPRAFPDRRAGHEHRHRRRDQPRLETGLETGASGARSGLGLAAGQLRNRAPSRRRRCAGHDRCPQSARAGSHGDTANAARRRTSRNPALPPQPEADC